MGDNFDHCECVWAHEFAIQRLLNFIRQNQDACTDTECTDVLARLQQRSSLSGDDTDTSSFTMMIMLMLFACFMYMIRPESLRNLTQVKQNVQGQGPHNGNGGPQPPPPAPPAPPSVN